MARPLSLALLILSALLLGLFTPPCEATNILYRDYNTLYAGYSLTQDNYRFTMQPDCNLVLYDNGKAVWSSKTGDKGRACHATLRRDGRLVIYPETGGNGIWDTGKPGDALDADYALVLQVDRNVVIYGPAKWATNTESTPISDKNPKNILGTDEILYAESSLTYGDYMLAMQVDCNLVVYDKGRAVWHTNTAGKGYRDCYLKMQSDGDLVVYSKDGKHRLWSSGTSVGGHKYYNLVLQPNRNVVIYGPAIFHTNTAAVSSAIKGIAMVTEV
ncbi:Mannose-specific lectin 2 [Acorus gramineus]|uniref:Mannose-specific lectin 2 n=1 Tax=Acorus gramineus TaxID=55184 RepID=A0AAV9B151_ACOGR|nr:Mannose-specific lectin 2 [Acorus gramineus]